MIVKKKGGKKEQFVKEKIVVAIMKSGGKAETARAIARDVETELTSKVVVTSEKLKSEILKRLKQKDAKAYRAWLAYNKKSKR